MSSKHSDLPEWLAKANTTLSDNEKLYLRFLVLSGLRVSEGISSFNLIIELSKNNELDEYYNEELEILGHYKYKQFLRNSKNVYITVIPKDYVMTIAESRPVHYITIRKHLAKIGLESRFKELRQQYATFMVRHDLIREEVDLLQGRVPKSIFIRHYWTPNFKELRDRTLKAVEQLESILHL
jgi:intergrase/recombinase